MSSQELTSMALHMVWTALCSDFLAGPESLGEELIRSFLMELSYVDYAGMGSGDNC